jgi:DNA-binding CsgD family transcriptional regulator
VRAKLGDPERVNELLFRLPKTFTANSFQIMNTVRKSPEQAAEILNAYPSDTPRRVIMKEILWAEALKGNQQEALKHLSVAASVAMKNGIRAIFIHRSQEIQNLMLKLTEREPTLYLESLASAIRADQQGSLRGAMGLSDPLTKREIDILRRLSSGLPITELAKTLHISHNTIKTHLKSIYRKINVESRAQALERAKDLLLV